MNFPPFFRRQNRAAFSRRKGRPARKRRPGPHRVEVQQQPAVQREDSGGGTERGEGCRGTETADAAAETRQGAPTPGAGVVGQSGPSVKSAHLGAGTAVVFGGLTGDG